MQTLTRPQLPITILRITLACLVAIHGWSRFLHGDVIGFGHYLGAHGVPFGMAAGVAVTAIEALASPVLAGGRLVFPLSLVYAFIYIVGIPVHHFQYGWFSSGSEVDGCEYPVFIIISFLCMAAWHAPARATLPRLGRQGA